MLKEDRTDHVSEKEKMDLSGLELVKAYREHPEQYYPMRDHTEQVPRRDKFGDINIGWYAGLLEENRPFFADCWAADHITWIAIHVSSKGIEGKTAEELSRWFQDIRYFRFNDDNPSPPNVTTYKKPNGDEFYMMTLCVGIDDEPALITGAPIIPWSVLNEYNRETSD